MPNSSMVSRQCTVRGVRSQHIIFAKSSLLFIALTLFALSLSFPGSSFAAPPAPLPCFNPIATDNLTDNYITNDKGDPLGPEGKNNPEALKFTFVVSGSIGSHPDLRKTITFRADFSKLQSIFAAPTSDYLEGRYQDPAHAQANLLAMKNPELVKHQGAEGKIAPTAITDDLRKKYVQYVNEKPELAESGQKFSDYHGQNAKNINDLVTTYGLPNPPSPSQDRTNWINTWGKYWENLPTVYNEFYIGKLEFRPVHGTAAIEALKKGSPGACFPNSSLRTVEFPVPNFFRTAATSGVLNQVVLPGAAQSQQNDLLGIQGAVNGVKNTAENIVKGCFKFAINNPVTNAVKKVIKVSLIKIDSQYTAYTASLGATNLSTSNQSCDTTTGKVSVRFNWTQQPNGAFFQADQQWLDLSTSSSFNDFLNHDVFGRSNYTTSTAAGNIGPLVGSTTHYWRINTHNSLNDTWYPSSTASFTTIACSVAVIVQNATNLSTSNQTCDSNTGRVSVKFDWTPGQEGGYLVRENQWLDLSLTNDNFTGAYIATSNPPSSGANTYTTGQSGGQIGTLDPSKTHYWRINTHYLNENWHSSSTASFTTIACEITQYATNLSVSDQVCDHNTGRINIKFSWTPGTQTGFLVRDIQYLDLSLANDNFASAYLATSNPPNKDATSYTTGQAGGQIGQLDPGKVHYWRIGTHYLNENWHASATGTFTTIPCQPTIDPPVITRVGNNKVVTFHFWPAGNGNFALVIVPTSGGPAVYDKIVPIGQTTMVWDETNNTPPNAPPRYGDWKASLVAFGVGYSNEVTFHIPYTLDPPTQTGRNVTFVWAPPVHIAPSTFGGVAIDVTRVSDGTAAWNSGGLAKDATTTTWIKAPPGVYKACIIFYPNVLDNACQNFEVTLNYLWTVFDLKPDSCIKVGKEGKAGNSSYCAIYPTKFEPAVQGQTNVNPGECTDKNTTNKLNDQTNVICNLTFEWKSSDYNGTDKDLAIPATGIGNWDDCDDESGGARTCYLTVGVWPDFRVPYLGQIWNNSLFSDTTEYLPTQQVTGQPGVYTLFTPKTLGDYSKQDPLATLLQGYVDSCKNDPPIASDPGNLRGCADLANWATTGNNATQYPGLKDCVEQHLFTNQSAMVTCLSFVTTTIINNLKKLPGEVTDVLGANSSQGQVLAANDGNQKERLIGAVDCGKHFSRDVALKPKALQEHLGITTDCNLASTGSVPGSTGNPPPGGGSPIPSPPPTNCGKAADANAANGIETSHDELVCYITQVASGKTEKKTGQPLDQVMIRVMDAESSGDQCAFAAAGEIGVFQYIAATWKSVGGTSGVDSGTVSPPAGNACWGTPGIDPVATTPEPASCPNCFNWPFQFGGTNDGDAWNPYHQIDATATEMEVSGGCPWSTFKNLFPGVCP